MWLSDHWHFTQHVQRCWTPNAHSSRLFMNYSAPALMPAAIVHLQLLLHLPLDKCSFVMSEVIFVFMPPEIAVAGNIQVVHLSHCHELNIFIIWILRHKWLPLTYSSYSTIQWLWHMQQKKTVAKKKKTTHTHAYIHQYDIENTETKQAANYY